MTKEHRTTEEEMEGPISFWRYKEQESNLILPEHHDDDDDDDDDDEWWWFSLQLLSETFLFLRRTKRHIVINVRRFPCEVPVILVKFWSNLNFLVKFEEKLKYQIPWKSVYWEPSCCTRTDRQTDRRDEADIYPPFHSFVHAPKKVIWMPHQFLRPYFSLPLI
jgi:hypothetical protein